MKTVLGNTLPENTITIDELVKGVRCKIVIAYSEGTGDFYKLQSLDDVDQYYAFVLLSSSTHWMNGKSSLRRQLELALSHSNFKLVVCDDILELATLISDVI